MLHCGSCSGTKSSAAEQLLVERAAQGEGHVDHVGEQLPAEQRPHAPQPEGRRPLGALHRLHAAVVFGQAGRGRVEQVGRVLAEGLETVAPVAVEHEGAEGRARRASCGRPRRRCRPAPARPPGAGAGRSARPRRRGRRRRAARLRAGGRRRRSPPAGRRPRWAWRRHRPTTATIGLVLRAQAGQLFVQPLRVHAPPLVQAHAHDLPAAQAEDARGSSHAVVGVGVGQQDGLRPVARQPALPHVAQGHVARGQQGGEVGERPAVRDGAGEGVRAPSRWPRPVPRSWPARRPSPTDPSRRWPSTGW